jgi:hypothetical protein
LISANDKGILIFEFLIDIENVNKFQDFSSEHRDMELIEVGGIQKSDRDVIFFDFKIRDVSPADVPMPRW